MLLTSSLQEFSVLEISHLIYKEKKTGLLKITASPKSPEFSASTHYIWVFKGQLVSAANQLDNQGLVSLIQQYHWASDRVVTKVAHMCPQERPLGLYLKNQGVLKSQHLKHLFEVQLFQQVHILFKIKDIQFEFQQDIPAPRREMTGLTLPAISLNWVLEKLIILQEIFELRNLLPENSYSYSKSDFFCRQIMHLLDIAFFHSLNFSLFDQKHDINQLSRFIDLYYFPYDLPKSMPNQGVSCALA
ncbi:MAG: DUF4388 domain-containing protein [Symploca sp. SIO1B1]|nr:DUF4388 domain-containing protein [Symploca sp. SIO1C2]NER48498.1 DUF4388 domain-containing protein [Symploca sp. SIO1A3]NER93041.1 DUF4388 domain-containing protein [Symploca sp. SIO1B1]